MCIKAQETMCSGETWEKLMPAKMQSPAATATIAATSADAPDEIFGEARIQVPKGRCESDISCLDLFL